MRMLGGAVVITALIIALVNLSSGIPCVGNEPRGPMIGSVLLLTGCR